MSIHIQIQKRWEEQCMIDQRRGGGISTCHTIHIYVLVYKHTSTSKEEQCVSDQGVVSKYAGTAPDLWRPLIGGEDRLDGE